MLLHSGVLNLGDLSLVEIRVDESKPLEDLIALPESWRRWRSIRDSLSMMQGTRNIEQRV
jgi:hypothetical protein